MGSRVQMIAMLSGPECLLSTTLKSLRRQQALLECGRLFLTTDFRFVHHFGHNRVRFRNHIPDGPPSRITPQWRWLI